MWQFVENSHRLKDLLLLGHLDWLSPNIPLEKRKLFSFALHISQFLELLHQYQIIRQPYFACIKSNVSPSSNKAKGGCDDLENHFW